MTPPGAISSLGLFGNPHREDLAAALRAIRMICEESGVTLYYARDLVEHLGETRVTGLTAAELVARSDMIIALGGDGTMLRAARVIGASGVPLLGINLGSLGYLTDVPVPELPQALRRVLTGDFHVEKRARVGCVVWRGARVVVEDSGFNDVVVNMGPLPRTLDLELRLDGISLGRFLGDGIIFATATGSTAYSLSAGGTICQPHLPGLLVTPICPHSLGVRPLILGDDVDIELVLHDVGNGATLTADGQVSTPLVTGDRVTCRLTPPVVNLIKFPQSNFFRVLRHKLNWGAHPRVRRSSRRHDPGNVGPDAGDPDSGPADGG